MLGEIIKKARKTNKLTQEKLSEMANVKINTIKNLETKNKINNDTELFRITKILKLDTINIFSKTEFNYLNTKLKYFETDKDIIKTVYCNSWESFFNYYLQNIFNSLDKELIWRGHKEVFWKLESTLLREFPEGIGEDSINVIIEKFKKSLLGNKDRIEIDKLKISDDKKENEELEWLALGQHNGLKTPLLDWTYSPFIGLYFAYSDSSDNSYRVLYAINRTGLEDIIKFGDELKIISIENHFNKRLINQQGLFIYSPLQEDIESWIIKNDFRDKKEIVLYKFYIPNSERIEILKILNKMNINPKTLFPDLNGAALHTNLEMEIEL